MIILLDQASADELSDARSMLLVHQPAPDGLCLGCYELACSFAWFPCPQARWAYSVLADCIDQPKAFVEQRSIPQ